jgi:hypothetical protein
MAAKATNVYRALEYHLRRAGSTPQTCADLFEHTDVRAALPTGSDANRISNYLGHLWRRGILQRWSSTDRNTSRARYGYTWRVVDEAPQTIELTARTSKTIAVLNNMKVTEEADRLVIELADFTITFEAKRQSSKAI